MKPLNFKVIEDKEEAKKIWNELSTHKKIDDEWDFRYAWVEELNYPLNFIAGYDNKKLIGLLALQINNKTAISQKLLKADKPFLEFFGGVDTDNNHPLTIPGYENYDLEFLKELKSYAILTDMDKEYSIGKNKSEFYLDRFELDLKPLEDFNKFLQTNFDGVSRQRLINRLNKLNKSYKVEIEDGKKELNLLFDLNIQRFGEDSSFHMQYRRNVYKKLMDLFETDVFVIKLDGKPKAISYGIIFKGTYTSVNIGYDLSVRDLQKLLVTTQIKRSIEKKCKIFDAGQGNNGWKEHFYLKKIPQYKLELNK